MDSYRWEVEKRSGMRGYTIELRFEGERLHIAYRGRDVGDGLGPRDEGWRKVLRRPQRRRQIAKGVILVVIVLASTLLGIFLGPVVAVVMMIALVAVVAFAFDSFKPDSALWNQSVRIGPDRLMFHRWRGNWDDDVYFTDVSRTPFCVRLIDSYRVDEEEIVVYGNFWNDHQEAPDDSGSDSGTRRVPGFKIARTFSDEDEVALLACLDRLKRV